MQSDRNGQLEGLVNAKALCVEKEVRVAASREEAKEMRGPEAVRPGESGSVVRTWIRMLVWGLEDA